MSETVNPMSVPRITKVCVNIGVGEGGDRLVNAENVLEMVTGVRPQRTLGKIQNRDLKVREGAPIGCRSTMRDQESIKEFLTNAFWVRDNTIPTGTLTHKETSRSVFVTTRISQSKNTIRHRYLRYGHQRRSRATWPPYQPTPKGKEQGWQGPWRNS